MTKNKFGNNRRRYRGRGGNGNGSKSSKPKAAPAAKRKTLEDYTYYVGSAKQASDYVTVTNYLVNYIRREYTKGDDIAKSLEELVETDFAADEPAMLVSKETGTGAAEIAKRDRENRQFEKRYEVDYAAHQKRVEQYQDNKATAAALLWNRCANTMRAKLQSRTDFEQIKGVPIKLLAAIRQHALSYESTKYSMKTVCDAMKSFINMRQKDDESSLDFLKRFKASRDVFLSHVGKEFHFPKTVEDDATFKAASESLLNQSFGMTDDQKKDALNEIRDAKKKNLDQFMAYLYMENCDHDRYGSLVGGLDTQYSLDHDQYPKTLLDAHNVISNHKYDPNYKDKKKRKEKPNKEKLKKDDDKSDREKKLTFANFSGKKDVCYCCGKGHKLPDCPEKHRVPKDQWVINKSPEAVQFFNFQKNIEETMQDDIARARSITEQNASATTSSLSNNEPSWNTGFLKSVYLRDEE